MNCPACGIQRTGIAVRDVKIQACKGGCGGLWFDEWTLRKVDQPDQSAGEALLHIEQNPAIKVDPEKRRNCPRDAGIVMMRHFWSVKRDVVVDECPKCEGIFLDPGELAGIRSDYKSDADRHKAAQAYYREMFDTQLAGMLREPAYASRIAFAESAANLGLLMLSVVVWYFRMLDWAAGPSVAVRVVTPAELASFVLTTAIAAVSYGLQRSATRT